MLSSHYKLSGVSHQVPCLICQTQYRGATQPFDLGFGVIIQLCPGHASREFRRQRSGRDFVLSVWKALRSAGRLTKNARRALDRHLEEQRPKPAPEASGRPRPGSYAWPDLRHLVEDACRKGVTQTAKLLELIRAHLKSELRRGRVKLPSLRTLRRWRFERRWDAVAP